MNVEASFLSLTYLMMKRFEHRSHILSPQRLFELTLPLCVSQKYAAAAYE